MAGGIPHLYISRRSEAKAEPPSQELRRGYIYIAPKRSEGGTAFSSTASWLYLYRAEAKRRRIN